MITSRLASMLIEHSYKPTAQNERAAISEATVSSPGIYQKISNRRITRAKCSTELIRHSGRLAIINLYRLTQLSIRMARLLRSTCQLEVV